MKLQFKANTPLDAYRQAKTYIEGIWCDKYVFTYTNGVGTLYLRGVE